MDPKNKYALYIVAMNQKDSEQRLFKLKEIVSMHPKYAMAFTQIGNQSY